LGKESVNPRKTERLIIDAPWSYDNEENYKKAQSEMYFKWRMSSLYVDYNLEERKWTEPSKFLIAENSQ